MRRAGFDDPGDVLLNAGSLSLRKHLARIPAEDLIRGPARHVLHGRVPDEYAQVQVVHNQPVAGAVDDRLDERIPVAQGGLGASCLRHVLDHRHDPGRADAREADQQIEVPLLVVPFELRRFSAHHDRAQPLDQLRPKDGVDLKGVLADDLVDPQAGQLLVGWVDVDEAVVDRLARLIEDHLVDRDGAGHLFEQELAAALSLALGLVGAAGSRRIRRVGHRRDECRRGRPVRTGSACVCHAHPFSGLDGAPATAIFHAFAGCLRPRSIALRYRPAEVDRPKHLRTICRAESTLNIVRGWYRLNWRLRGRGRSDGPKAAVKEHGGSG